MARDSAGSASEATSEEQDAPRVQTSIRARFWRVMEGPSARPATPPQTDEQPDTD